MQSLNTAFPTGVPAVSLGTVGAAVKAGWSTNMRTILLDCNIYDLLESDGSTVVNINKLIRAGSLKVLVTRTVAEELGKSPFQGVPKFFPTEFKGNTVGRLGLMTCSDSIGEGAVFDAHLGTSKHVNDALIADAASWMAQFLISEDIRLRSRISKVTSRCKAMSYAEFKATLNTWSEPQERQ